MNGIICTFNMGCGIEHKINPLQIFRIGSNILLNIQNSSIQKDYIHKWYQYTYVLNRKSIEHILINKCLPKWFCRGNYLEIARWLSKKNYFNIIIK